MKSRRWYLLDMLPLNCDELQNRDKVSLDISWLKGKALAEPANLPIAAEITADWEAAMKAFAIIAEDLKK